MYTTLCSVLLTGAAWAATPGDRAPDNAVQFTAVLKADALTVGQEYVLEVSATPDAAQGFSFTGRRSVAPILQLKVSDSVRVSGPGRSRDYLRPPYELQLPGGKGQVRFTLTSAPKPRDAILLNFAGYIQSADKKHTWLVRKRGMVALKPGATLEALPAGRGEWQDASTLALGDKAVAFKLPDKDGKVLDLNTYLGKKNIILLTYRAHW